MSAAYHTRVQALREELAQMQAEAQDVALDGLADLINIGMHQYAYGGTPGRRDLGIIRGATLAGLRDAQDAGWRLLPPEPERDH